jgi:heptosyltransferase-2/heptosyltransferase-3
MHPGSGAAVKRWRTGAWAELASQLADQHGSQIIFTGTADEATLIEPILAALVGGELKAWPISLAGQTDLHTLAAVYRRCSLVIGPDSGPLHLAVAMGTPTVHLYGPVDRATFGPWGAAERHRVLTSDWACVPCNRLDWPVATTPEHGCVRDITVGQVLEAAAGLLR